MPAKLRERYKQPIGRSHLDTHTSQNHAYRISYNRINDTLKIRRYSLEPSLMENGPYSTKVDDVLVVRRKQAPMGLVSLLIPAIECGARAPLYLRIWTSEGWSPFKDNEGNDTNVHIERYMPQPGHPARIDKTNTAPDVHQHWPDTQGMREAIRFLNEFRAPRTEQHQRRYHAATPAQ